MLPANLERIIKKARQLGMKVDLLPWKKPVVRIKHGQKTRYFYDAFLPLNHTVGARLSKYKSLSKEIFVKIGMTTPKGFLCKEFNEALKKIKKGEIKYPVVVKPNDTALGEGVTVGISNDQDLKIAIEKLPEKHKEFLLEEYVQGNDYRLLVLDGQLIAACQRIPPFVTGNGQKSLKELIDDFNQNREKKLKIDWEVSRNLKEQKVGLTTIIPQGQKIILRKNANIFTGGISKDVTDLVASRFKKLAIKVAEELGLRLAGVDILTDDLTSEKGDYYLTEVNGLPSFDIHETPTFGLKRDVTSLILKAIFASPQFKNEWKS
ncbi:ATP-grasp domain-containing protein [Candidatus Shapirobacteria bacterium]|nr:ATP-grasp domain-containing protein [Candidatus Shapirobacteria bacterium]